VTDSLTDSAGIGPGKVGRYFTVVSLLPASTLVAYVALLVRSGALTGSVNFAGAVKDVNLGTVAIVGLVALLIALALNPLQFVLLQLAEGYWGASPLALELQLLRMSHHRRRQQRYRDQYKRADKAVRASGRQLSDPDLPTSVLAQHLASNEARRLKAYYPDHPEDVMPTRLGNVLRRYERIVGRTYGMNVIASRRNPFAYRNALEERCNIRIALW